MKKFVGIHSLAGVGRNEDVLVREWRTLQLQRLVRGQRNHTAPDKIIR